MSGEPRTDSIKGLALHIPRKILGVITLLSDFGLSDPYVAQMKAVIRSTSADVEIVDISHGIEKHSVASGSYVLETTVPFFPKGSIHVAVVDPGVGGPRIPIVIACHNGVLIGPDNGLLGRAAERLGFQAAYQIQNSEFLRTKVSSTFHGRDIFAYAAAKIALGMNLTQAGPKLERIVRLKVPDPVFLDDHVTCHALYVDSFGNVVTNISESNVQRLRFREGKQVKVVSGKAGEHFEGLIVKSYFEIPEGPFGLILGSQGYLEVALREARAAGKLRVKPLDPLEIRFS